MTDPIGETTPETARALLWRHGLPEDVIDGVLALFAQELAGKIRAHRDHTRGAVQATKVMDFAAELISPEHWAHTVPAVPVSSPPPDQTADELAFLAVNAGRALQDEKRHYEIACQEIARLRATVERVRRLHDALDAETGLASPGDEITRGAAARKIAAALDGWTDPDELRRLAAEAQPEPGIDPIDDYLKFLRGQGPEPDLSGLPPEQREAAVGQFEIVRALADRDPSLPPLDRDPVARRLGLHAPAAEAQQQPDTETPTCPDPIECAHEAALGQAQQQVKRVRDVCDQLRRASVLADGEPHTDRERGIVQAVTRVMAALDKPAAGSGRVAAEARPETVCSESVAHIADDEEPSAD